MARRDRRPQMSGLFDWLWKPPAEKPQAPGPGAPPPGVDLYLLLGVSPDSGSDEIRSAYRRLAAQFHPDRNPNDPDAVLKFHAIGKAHDILSNPDARRAYDRTRKSTGTSQKPMYPAPIIVEEEGPSRRAKPGAQKPPSGKPEPSVWETMFGKAGAEEAEAGNWYDAFSAPGQRGGAPSSAGIFGRRPVDLPDRADIEKILKTFPLEWIAEVARYERLSPGFRQAGGVVIDNIAGMSGAVEADLAELFGLDFSELDEYTRMYGRNDLWKDVLSPLLKVVGDVMTSMKAQDLPGFFAFDWDQSGQMIDLLYGEETGRPWR